MAQMTIRALMRRLLAAMLLSGAVAASAAAQSAGGLDAEIDLAMGAFDRQPFEREARWSAVEPEEPLAHQGEQPFDQEPPFAQFDFQNFGVQGGVCDPQLQICL